MHQRRTRIVELPRVDGAVVPVRVAELEAVEAAAGGRPTTVRLSGGRVVETPLTLDQVLALISAASTRRITVPC